MGNSFFCLPNRKASEMVKKDQVHLDKDINILRSDLKVKVNQLREKEGKKELQGFGLKALSKEEMTAVGQVVTLDKYYLTIQFVQKILFFSGHQGKSGSSPYVQVHIVL